MEFKSIEKKWKDRWVKEKIFSANDNSKKEKMYVLVEFPYPSGEGLHIGHAFTMTGGDVYARFQRMCGKEVLFPMGYDAFGLPTENYAIRVKRKPQDVTNDNCKKYSEQMKHLAYSFDWDREINTSDPEYYKWTQWIFTQMFKKGLANKENKDINWCPSCKTGLANEEVISGKCERCGTETSKKKLNQWILKITEYADRLTDDLFKTEYQEHIKIAQKNWIGRTYGVNIEYPLVGDENKSITCYSTRPDTNYGTTFIAISPENPLVLEITNKEHRAEVEKYMKKSKKKSEREKIVDYSDRSGVFTGRYCLNRLTGKEMPIYIADFVVGETGTGSVVGVPAHDERDFDFAKKHGIEIVPVIKPEAGKWDFEKKPYTNVSKSIVFNSEIINGLKPKDAIEKIIGYIEKKGWGERTKNYHLRDWIFSRQHYWGEPIPMINCKKCGWVPVPESDLPVKLPDVERYEPSGTGKSPLSKIKDWVNTKCPKCGGPAERETDTMPNWAGSCWYFLRYLDPQNNKELASMEKMKAWMPVYLYFGGSEHTYLHLLYSRFWYKFLYDIGVVPNEEPYLRRIEHGVILGLDGKRMSKSRGNVISPDEVADKYGVDTIRTYLMFMGPFNSTMAWNDNAVVGVGRFLKKYYDFVSEKSKNVSSGSSDKVKRIINKTIKRVKDGIDKFSFNTAIASMMEMRNSLDDTDEISKDTLEKMVLILSPFAPYTAEELWEVLGNKFSVHVNKWPKLDEKALEEKNVIIPIQVNGKRRGEVDVERDSTEGEIREKALKVKNVSKYVNGKRIKKFIYVSGRIVNIVV